MVCCVDARAMGDDLRRRLAEKLASGGVAPGAVVPLVGCGSSAGRATGRTSSACR